MDEAHQNEPIPSSSETQVACVAKEDEPLAKKKKLDELNEKLENRLGGILCCAVCLELPQSAVYQCINGHLMCATCFTHLLADARLRDEAATCPNCRVEISKSSASRNLAVEKTVSELPAECKFCTKVYPRHSLPHHEENDCENRETGCSYACLGCPWRGPWHEAASHEADCSRPQRSAREALASLAEREASHKAALALHDQLLDMMSMEKIAFNDLQLKPYRTEEYVHKLYYETSRFSAFGHQWVVKAFVNNNERDPTQSSQREISYQLILKSKPLVPVAVQWAVLRGPWGGAALAPELHAHVFSEERADAPPRPLPLAEPAAANRLLAERALHCRYLPLAERALHCRYLPLAERALHCRYLPLAELHAHVFSEERADAPPRPLPLAEPAAANRLLAERALHCRYLPLAERALHCRYLPLAERALHCRYLPLAELHAHVFSEERADAPPRPLPLAEPAAANRLLAERALHCRYLPLAERALHCRYLPLAERALHCRYLPLAERALHCRYLPLAERALHCRYLPLAERALHCRYLPLAERALHCRYLPLAERALHCRYLPLAERALHCRYLPLAERALHCRYLPLAERALHCRYLPLAERALHCRYLPLAERALHCRYLPLAERALHCRYLPLAERALHCRYLPLAEPAAANRLLAERALHCRYLPLAERALHCRYLPLAERALHCRYLPLAERALHCRYLPLAEPAAANRLLAERALHCRLFLASK
ncbi:hypothetical protein ACJJTC_012960 [Scirpophaga incertulas]